MWVMILEKAWAKAFGTYQHIIYGLPGECLTNLTGAPCKYVPRTREDLWEKVYEACTCEKGVKSKARQIEYNTRSPLSPSPAVSTATVQTIDVLADQLDL